MSDNGPCNCEQALGLQREVTALVYRMQATINHLKDLCSCNEHSADVCPDCSIAKEIRATLLALGEESP